MVPVEPVLRANIKFFGRRGRFIRDGVLLGLRSRGNSPASAVLVLVFIVAMMLDPQRRRALWRGSVVTDQFECRMSLNDWRSLGGFKP